MKPQTLGLCIIAKNEEGNIGKALQSVLPNVDYVYLTDTGSTDNTIEEAKTICEMSGVPITVSHFEWINDFSAARNFNFEQAATDWIFWMDCDDIVENPEELPKLVNMAELQKVTGVHLTYRYQVDENDMDVIAHPKLRLVKREMYEWFRDHAQVHENLVVKDGYEKFKKEAFDKSVKLKHLATEEHFKESARRNLEILNGMRVKEGDNPDPRTMFLLGREYHTQGDYQSSIEALTVYLKMDKMGSTRLEACAMLADIFKKKGDFVRQLKMAQEGLHSYPNNPKGYLMVAEAYLNSGAYNEAIEWVGYSKSRSVEDSDPMIQSPRGILYQSAVILSNAYVGLRNYEEAFKALKNFIPFADKKIKDELYPIMADYEQLALTKKYMQGFTRLSHLLLRNRKPERIPKLIDLLPEELLLSKEVINLKRDLGIRKEWSKGNIVIFCGGSYEEWSEETIKTKGLGGSETAVIEQSKRLGKQGYKVTVYNSVKEKQVFGNVTYIPFKEINFADKFDIFIIWRNPHILKMFDIQANKIELWMHDVPNPEDFTEDVWGKVDKIIMLSKHHSTFIPAVPKEKIYYSSNGIDVETIEKIEKENIKRNPYKVIYASSPDRGLENLLDMWADVKKEVPEAELKVVYGWETFDALRANDPVAMEWKASMQAKMKELGVEDTVRLPKEDLYREYFSSSIWAYPTEFDEINCIVAQEAQACGCYPVTTGKAALAEMQPFGVKTSKETLKDKLIDALQNNPKLTNDEIKFARENFSWDKTANSWCKDLLYGIDFKQEEPLVNVVCLTIRPGPFRILKETLEKQTYKNFNLIVIDGRYDERKEEVAEYFKDAPFPILHLPDPERDKDKYPYGLFHGDNAGLFACNGELAVFLQDFIEIPEDGLEKFVENYRNHPEAIYTGVDIRVKTRGQQRGKDGLGSDKLDIFGFGTYDKFEKDFESPRKIFNGAIRESKDPFEWELNWAAAPVKVLREMGGWNNEWDEAFAFDNTELALRFVYSGGIIIVDETNEATAISHWEIFGDHDEEGVPHRTKKTNDATFQNYLEYLQQTSDAQVKLKLEEPKYSNYFLKQIQKWKKN